MLISNTSNIGDMVLTKPDDVPEQETSEETDVTDEDSVGLAWLADDGTLVLQLKVIVNDREDRLFIEIEPTDPKFTKVLNHLGGLRYGENKRIKEFDDGLLDD